MKDMYPIGIVSKMLDISVESIRYYQKEGLVIPNYIDAKTNYRYFDEKNLEELFNIVFLRDSGFSIAEIKNLGNISNQEKLTTLNKKIKHLEKEIYREQMLVKFLKKKEAGMKLLHSDKYVYKIIVKEFPDRYGNFLAETSNCPIIEHTENINKLESSLSYVNKMDFSPSRITYRDENTYILEGLMCMFSGSVSNATEYIEKILVKKNSDDIVNSDNKIKKEFLSAGKYLSLLVKGIETRDEAYSKLIEYALENNIVLNNRAIEILILDCNFLVNDDSSLREIQIRILD